MLTGATCCLEDDALSEAVRYADVEAVKDALRRGCSPNTIGIYQWTPIHEAASSGEHHIVELLLENGGQANVQDSLKGRSPLHYAAENDHVRCVQILLSAGSDMFAVDKDGCSALDVAKGRSRMLLVKSRDETTNGARLSTMPQETTSAAREHASPQSGICEESPMPASECPPHVSPLGEAAVLRGMSEPSSRAVDANATAFGYLTLSVEYNSKRSSLKVRPWQLSDLLVPPRQRSSLSSVYIKSYLLPDRPRATKRKSEEVNVYSVESARSRGDEGSYQPASFQFAKALEYSGVTREMVSECTLWLEVCFTQRLTRRSFTCASMCVPLREAVRKLMRERVPLRACPGLPADMRLFSAHDANALFLYNERLFYSQPELRGRTGQGAVEDDRELQSLSVHQMERPLSVCISLPEEDTHHDSLPVLVHQSPRDDSSLISMESAQHSDDSDSLQQVQVHSMSPLSDQQGLDDNDGGESIV